MEKFVKVPLDYYLQLERINLELRYLESCGVDNWDSGISRENWAQENNQSWDELQINEKNCRFDIIEE